MQKTEALLEVKTVRIQVNIEVENNIGQIFMQTMDWDTFAVMHAPIALDLYESMNPLTCTPLSETNDSDKH